MGGRYSMQLCAGDRKHGTDEVFQTASCRSNLKASGKLQHSSDLQASPKETPTLVCQQQEEQEDDRFCQLQPSHRVHSNEPEDEPVKCSDMGVKIFSSAPEPALKDSSLPDKPSESPSIIVAPPLGVDNQVDYFRACVSKEKNILVRAFDILKGCRPGSDVSSICVPASFNLPKSQVQLFSEQVYCCSQNLLEQCADAATPLDRFLAVVRWQLSLIRPAPFLKAPYNPILGETHHVSAGDFNLIAEQVSHHPPETVVHATNTKKGIAFFQSCKPTPRFWGRSLDVTIYGRQSLTLAEHGETYELTPPNLTFRFLPTTCSEWTGETTLRCPETDLDASVTFKPRSLLRGAPNTINGKIKSTSSGKVLYSLCGQWDKTVVLEETATGNKTVFYDGNAALSKLKAPVIRSPQELSPLESVVVWSKVTEGLWREDWEAAREEKLRVEENQRALRNKRSEVGDTWLPKYFTQTVHGDWEWALKGQPVPQGPIAC